MQDDLKLSKIKTAIKKICFFILLRQIWLKLWLSIRAIFGLAKPTLLMLLLLAILLFLNPAIPAQTANQIPVQTTNKIPAQTDNKILTPLEVVEYTLKLEKLEADFYHRGIEATKNGGLRKLPQEVKDAIASFSKDDDRHVEDLSNILKNYGRDPAKITISKTIDYHTILGRNPFANPQDFLLAMQLIEDLGVAAYKGQMQNLLAAGISAKAILATALQIHSVEARHAAGIRLFREKLMGDKISPWIENPYEVIYPENRNNTSIPFQSPAFDSYATQEEVLNLLNPILGTNKLNNAQASSQDNKPIRGLF